MAGRAPRTEMDKTSLRTHFLGLRRGIAATERSGFDRAICDNVRRLDCWREAECVALYASDGEEPELSGLFGEKGKRFYFPRWRAERKEYELVRVEDLESDFVRGRFGLFEPRSGLLAASSEEWARMLVLTPAVACDRRGVRLGRGGGFYDRMLVRSGGATVAVVYACQLSESLPQEPHDRLVAFAVTEEGVLEF